MQITKLKKQTVTKRAKYIPAFLPELILCFLVSRASLFGQPLPAGLALGTVCAKSKKGRWLCLLSALAGYCSLSFHPRYPLSLFLVALVLWVDEAFLYRNFFCTALVVSGALFVSDLFFVIKNGAIPYDLFLLVLCTAGGFLCTGLFQNGLDVLKSKTRHYLRPEDSLGLLVLLTFTARGIPVLCFSLLNISNTICIFLTLLFARSKQSEHAVTAGLVSAFLMSTDLSSIYARLGMFALAGLFGNLFRTFGKCGVCLGALLSGLLASVTMGELEFLGVSLLDFPLACLIFFLFPSKWMERLGVYQTHPDQSENEIRIKESVCQQLKSISSAFLQLSSSVFSLAGQPEIGTSQAVLLSKIEERVCSSCKLKNLCWKRETTEMETLTCHCFAIIEQKGFVCKQDLPVYFRKRCDSLPNYLYEINNLYELYKNELFWQGRLDRATAFTIHQLEDMAVVIDKLADHLNQTVSFHEELAFSISCELDRRGYAPQSVEVIKNSCGRYQVHMTVNSCQMTDGCKEIASLLSQLLECPMEKTEGDCRLNQCTLGFLEATPYRLLHAVSATPKEGQKTSGDTYASLTLPDGNALLILSDGKGSGDAANLQSSETVRLLCRLLYAGFSPTSAVRLANSVLGQQPDEEGFATIDLMLVDLSEPRADFIKSGASATYLKRQNIVKRIESQSLPAGILDEADMELKSEPLQNGDLLVMLSDGVADAFSDEKFLMSEINRLSRHNSPRQLSAALLDSAKQQKGNHAYDDMTVVAARLAEK